MLLRTKRNEAYLPPLTTIHGHRLRGRPIDSILNEIVFYRGEFEPVLSRLIKAVVEPGDLCVDAGANAGYFTLLFADRVGAEGRVWAVEASPPNVARLRANIAENGFSDRATVIGAAYSRTKTEAIRFFVNRHNDMLSRLSLPGPFDPDFWIMGGKRAWNEIAVPATTLHASIGADTLRKVRFMKIDIEGAEPEIVPEILALCTHPRLMIALEAKPPLIEKTLEPLHREGFIFYDLRNDYRWMLERETRRPRRLDFDRIRRANRMIDVLATRIELPDELVDETRGGAAR